MACSNAPRLAYGTIQKSTSSFVNYTCNSGYTMQGTPYIECVNGVWNMTNYPICLFSLDPYTDSDMTYHADSNTTTDQAPEFPEWFTYGVMGAGGSLALALVVSCLLACCHICGCCPGPVIAIGGRYQYSDRRWYSVFKWCDFMTKGKVCRKIRKMNKSKTILPVSDTLTIEDETDEKKDESIKPNETKDGKPPDDSEKQTNALDNDVSSSTSGYASSSPPSSPLPEEEPLLPENKGAAVEESSTDNKAKNSQLASDNPVLTDIVEENFETSPREETNIEVKAETFAEEDSSKNPQKEESLLPNNESNSPKASDTEIVIEQPATARDVEVVVDIEEDNSQTTTTDKNTTKEKTKPNTKDKTVKTKTKQNKKKKK